MTALIKHTAALGCIIFLCSCASVQSTVLRANPDYNELPVDSVSQAALNVEQGIKDGKRELPLESINGFILDTPEVKQALRSRAARSELIQDILTRGHAVEKRNGKISIIRSSAYKKSTSSKMRDRDALFIIMENRDRVIMYQSLTDANKLSPAARSALEVIFQRARVDQMEPGQLYDDAEGNPASK
ncbi:MAG: hypothetical protein COA73_04680 [Candidatus Hydrogenedentota bacterium]|nr:MAG: hypothetical protein COA73_04680 [Candidatus Hydrogenedentota bacterium]